MLLTARNLSKRYHGARDIDAVRDVSLDLDAGRFLAVVGRSGSGKSTLLGMIGGLIRPSGGVVRIDGADPWSLGADELAAFRGSNIGFVFQMPSLLPTLRAIDNVALPALIGKTLDSRAAYDRAEALLRRVGLADRIDGYPAELSGGEQRRVALARSLVNSPRLLLADEPTGDLDEETEAEILDLLLDLRESEGLALVVVTHSLAIAERAHSIVEIRRGAVASVETPKPQARTRDAAERRPREPDGPPVVGAPSPAGLGAGLGRFAARFAVVAAVIVSVIGAANWAVGRYQRHVIQRRWEAARALEDLAMAGLRADIESIAFGHGNSYRLVLYLRNVSGDRELYVTAPQVHAYVQVGTSWREVPLRAVDGGGAQVARIEGKQLFAFDFEPDVESFEQLLPHYMHVRITNTMLVSPRSEPKQDELVERADSYYTYLKPHGADDAAILRDLKFPGKPPLWIPMPPH